MKATTGKKIARNAQRVALPDRMLTTGMGANARLAARHVTKTINGTGVSAAVVTRLETKLMIGTGVFVRNAIKQDISSLTASVSCVA
jgi:hypothetical protein